MVGTQAPPSETEQQILSAALEVFAAKGREGARMQEIADLAGINKAMLHYYFRSKDRLYEAVIGHVLGPFIAAFGEAVRDADSFAATLRIFVDEYVRFVAANLNVVRLVVNDSLSGGAVIGSLFARMIATGDTPPALFIERMKAAIAAGEIRAVEPGHVLITVVSASVFPFVVAPIVRNVLPGAMDESFARARAEHIFDLVYNGIKA
jgi:TetR/AcrR family transcriptional regulator